MTGTRPGWLPTEREGDEVTRTRVGISWDAVQARVRDWWTLRERMARQPGIYDRKRGTLTWLVPRGTVGWWRLPPGIARLEVGASVAVPPEEWIFLGGDGPEKVIHWLISPLRSGGLTDPGVLMSAIHAARVVEWMPETVATWLPVGRWRDAVRAPRREVWTVPARLENAPAIAAEETLTWLVPSRSLAPADLPPGVELLAGGRLEIPPATAARTGPHTHPPRLHWTAPPGEHAVAAPPDELLRELHAVVARLPR